jgi:hypothetical protein
MGAGTGETTMTTTILVTIFCLAVFGLPLWFVAKAKPIGEQPYHWGTWVGITSVLVGLAAFGDEAMHTPGAWLLVVLAGLYIVAGVGVLQRRRYGVKFWFVASAANLLLCIAAIALGVPDTKGELSRSLGGVIIGAPINFIYFRNRWHLMGPEGEAQKQC